jgi:hypothetical protein
MRSSGMPTRGSYPPHLVRRRAAPNLLTAAHWPAESASVTAPSAEPMVSGRHQKHAVHTQGVIGLDTTDFASKPPAVVKEP